MDQLSHDRGDEDEIHSDQPKSSSGFEPARPPLQLDPCDFLLDAIDAQLGKLQVKHCKRLKRDCIDSAAFRLNQSLSKDTGLGSTVSHTNDTPMSHHHDLQVAPADITNYVAPEVTSPVWTSTKVELESHKEEFMWRLERLLGDTCKDGAMSGAPHPPTESICTEDFVRCFREEMIELPLPERSVQALDKEEEANRTVIFDRETHQNNYRSEASTNVKSSKDTASVAFIQYKPEQREEEKCPSESSGVQTLHNGEKVFYGTTAENKLPKHISSPKPRCLAGVPVWNFDTVSIDSDLDSVCSDQVRQHLDRRAGILSKAVQNKRTNLKETHVKTDTFRAETLLDEDKDTDEESKGHWRRRSKLEKASEKMHSAWEKMNERLSSLRLRCEKEEETLRMKKSHLNEVELSLSELQLRRKHAFQDLERLSAETGHLETEKSQLEVLLNERKTERDSLICQIQKLHRQRESCAQSLEEELKKKDQLKQKSRAEESHAGMSELERQEMATQLACAKAELISEQQRAREKQESMQQILEETCEKLLRVSEAETSLRKRCSYLEDTQKLKKKDYEVLRCEASELQGKLGACTVRVDALEKMLRQKERQLQDLQEQHAVLQTEGANLTRELEFIKSQNHSALKEARENAHTMMEAALKQQRKDLVTVHEQQIQKLKKDEASALKNSLERQQDESRKREEKLHAETLAKVCKAVNEERRKWEAEKMEAVHFHCGLLEEQNKRSLETVRNEIHQERSNALSLQHKVAELQSRVQDLEAERCVQQREQESLLSAVRRSMKQEQQDKLEKLQKDILQESEKRVQQAKAETERLHEKLEEQEISHSEARIEQEKQFGIWVRELAAEFEFLHILVENNGGQQNTTQIPPCSTIDEALLRLKAQRVPLKNQIDHLHQELKSQKQANEQLVKDKELELKIQRQQMRTERNQALDSLKERLIQEHIEELSSLKWSRISDGGLEASLRKQLQAKDMELRQVQRNMTQWKEQTTARLACKFEDELTAELERCRAKLLRGSKTSTNEEEKLTLKGQRKQGVKHQHAQHSDCLTYVYTRTPQRPTDLSSLKLVHYLQSRVKQLRVENQSWTPAGPILPALGNQEGEKA
ncbi:trichohyalin [Corythoichthys intestinalis]|uniref:trichohyalin n=1 Tax=Corythoichthys intestinalis TaxID=161448 RepID=UPI0025A4EE2C|nr:trichohyalin [Corythoichthys intestinalis]